MKASVRTFLLIVIFGYLAFLLSYDILMPSGCKLIHSNGGCNDNEIFLYYNVKPQINCIYFSSASCVRPAEILIKNNCNNDIKIYDSRMKQDDLIIEQGHFEYLGLELRGSKFIFQSTINGTVGNQSFTISYIKTGPLCS